jgi:hypothetical protein
MHLDDERLSAVADGLADADDVAHADICPECQARLQQWQRVLGQLGSTPDPSPDADRREAAIAAARAENVSGLEGARKRRRLRSFPAAGVAAALLVVAGLAFGLSQVSNNAPHTAGSSSAAKAPATATAPATGSPSTTVGQAPQASGAAAAPSLGSFDTPSSLVAALRRMATVAGPQALGPLRSGCQLKAVGDASVPSTNAPSFSAPLTYRGQPSSVSVFLTRGGHVAVVEGDQRCVLLAKVTYP